MNRNRYDIIRDILKVCRDGALKSHIVFKANLNFTVVKAYLKDLIDGNLLIVRAPFFHTTDEGVMYMELFEDLEQLL